MDFKRKHKANSAVNWLIGLAMLASIYLPQNSNANSDYQKAFNYYEIGNQHYSLTIGGSITMLETILRIDTDNISETIEHIILVRFENGFVENLRGCRNSVCEINTKEFPKGGYKVIVKTSQTTFSDSIIIH